MNTQKQITYLYIKRNMQKTNFKTLLKSNERVKYTVNKTCTGSICWKFLNAGKAIKDLIHGETYHIHEFEGSRE